MVARRVCRFADSTVVCSAMPPNQVTPPDAASTPCIGGRLLEPEVVERVRGTRWGGAGEFQERYPLC